MGTLHNRLRRLEQFCPPEPNALAELTDRELDEMIAADCAAEFDIPLDKPVEELSDRELNEVIARSYGIDVNAIKALSDEGLQGELSTRMLSEVQEYFETGNL